MARPSFRLLIVLLGLALVAAAPASAHKFRSETAPMLIYGESSAIFENSVNTALVKCATANIAGTLPESTASQLRLTPEYTKCTSTASGGPVETLMNGCEFVWAGATSGEHGSLSLECPPGTMVELKVLFTTCVATFKTQVAEKGVRYTNEGSGSGRKIKATVTATELDYEMSGFCTPYLGNGKDGRLNSTLVLKGVHPALGTPVGFWVE